MTPGGITVHTLGPEGTNCEAAAWHWLNEYRPGQGTVVLYPALEDAVSMVLKEPERSVLLSSVGYPQLHKIIYQNLRYMSLRDCFTMPTHPMVLGARSDREIRTVLTHPAPVNLLDGMDVRLELVSSNAVAAAECAQGRGDACITTRPAAEANGLQILRDFGPINMGFALHVPFGCEVWPAATDSVRTT